MSKPETSIHSDMDNALDDIYSADKTNKWRFDIQRAYEQQIVKKLMQTLGFTTEINEFLKDIKQTTGEKPYLSVAYFNSQYPSFPVWLVPRKIGYMYQVTLKDLFNKFSSSKLATAWIDAYDEQPKDKPTALVFDVLGVKGKQLVCHNYGFDTAPTSETHILHRLKGEDNHLLCITRFESFLDDLSRTWVVN
jgi:hypothetical protein